MPELDVQAVTGPGTVDAQPQVQQPTTDVGEPGNADSGAPQVPEDDPVKELHRKLNERQIENYRLQQRLAELESRLVERTQVQEDKNPFDPATQWEQWDAWRIQKAAERAQSALLQTLQNLALQSAEQQWQAQHPDVNLLEVKNFARSRWGVQNFTEAVLNDAYALMTQGEQLNRVRTNTFNQTLQQFRQPAQAAVAVRPGQQSGAPTRLSLEALAKEYLTDPVAFEKKYPPEIQEQVIRAARFEATR